jgi:hypothetical protein
VLNLKPNPKEVPDLEKEKRGEAEMGSVEVVGVAAGSACMAPGGGRWGGRGLCMHGIGRRSSGCLVNTLGASLSTSVVTIVTALAAFCRWPFWQSSMRWHTQSLLKMCT